MKPDQVFESFLHKQLDDGMALARSSDVLKLTALPGNPPSRYVAHFDGSKGLVQRPNKQIVEFDQCIIGICFSENYLRQVNIPEVLTYLARIQRRFTRIFARLFVACTLSPAPVWWTSCTRCIRFGRGTCMTPVTKD